MDPHPPAVPRGGHRGHIPPQVSVLVKPTSRQEKRLCRAGMKLCRESEPFGDHHRGFSRQIREAGCPRYGKEPGAALPSLPCPRGGKPSFFFHVSSPGTFLKALRGSLGGGLGTNSSSNLETKRQHHHDPGHHQPLPLATITCSQAEFGTSVEAVDFPSQRCPIP